MTRKKGFPYIRLLVHLVGVFPLGFLLVLALGGGLSVNPIQDIEQRLGRTALYFLIASLAVTPVITITGWHTLSPRRRALGLYTFLYASLHFITFAVLDYGLDLVGIGRLILEKPFILLGLLTGLILLPLAVTSFDIFKQKMGRRWKSLHRLIYLAGITVIFHYALAKKGDLFSLQGDVLKPLLWGCLIVFLLIMRLTIVKSWVIGLRQKITRGILSRKYPPPGIFPG